jgi:hypothetical protein
MDKPITYVGLDVHKDTMAIALAEAGMPTPSCQRILIRSPLAPPRG